MATPEQTRADGSAATVPLRDLLTLVRFARMMRNAQRDYFKRRAEIQRKKLLHLNADQELARAMKAEREFDAALAEAERKAEAVRVPALPGMDSGEGGDPS